MRFAPRCLKKGFLEFSDTEPLKTLVILRQCSDNAQTYKIGGHFNLDGEKLKTEAQNIILFFFTFANFSRLARVDFGSVLFQLTFHPRIFTLQLRLL